MPSLLKSPDARVVSVSSAAHLFADTVDWDDLNAQAPGAYAPWKAYGLSKLSNIFFAKGLQKRVDQKGGTHAQGSTDLGSEGGVPLSVPGRGFVSAVSFILLKAYSLCFGGLPCPTTFDVNFWCMGAVLP